jgi:hypothetical protein
VLTPGRAFAVALVVAGVVFGLSRLVARIERLGDFTVPSGPYLLLGLILLVTGLISLRTEDARLTRELRIAYAGTVTAREQAVRRRLRASWFTRLFMPPHGLAALLLASGDPESVIDLLATGSPLYLAVLGARLGHLRAIITAGARASVAAAAAATAGSDENDENDEARSAALVTLLATRGLDVGGSADLARFRAFVLARAVLETGDVLTARELAFDLKASRDADVRLYAEWLRTWFDLDDPGLQPEGEGERRRAALHAVNAGARDLAEKLTAAAPLA